MVLTTIKQIILYFKKKLQIKVIFIIATGFAIVKKKQ